MKKKITYMLAAFAAVAFTTTGCSSDDDLALQDSTKQEGKTIALTLEATRGAADGTRTTITKDDNYGVLNSAWAEGDVIYVYDNLGAQVGTLTVDKTSFLNQKSSTTATTTTSYAKFTGTISSFDENKEYEFVYQGSGRSLTATNGKLSYTLNYLDDASKINTFDIAWAKGKIQGTTGSNSASVSVSFANKLAFGYFTTKDYGTEGNTFDATYYSGFTFDVISGNVIGIAGTVSLPEKSSGFYLPLILNAECNISKAVKIWTTDDSGAMGYYGVQQTNAFTPTSAGYYRMGKTSNYGPVEIKATDFVKWETMHGKTFDISAARDGSKTVTFTQGNLQYMVNADGETGYWQIAESQYSCLGSSNAKPSTDNDLTCTGNIDLFGWGAIPTANGTICAIKSNDYYPCGTGTSKTWTEPTYNIANADLNGTNNYDWGQYIKTNSLPIYISKADNKTIDQPTAGYRTLTSAEWGYLFNNHKWAYVTVTDKTGMACKGLGIVVCPDGVTEVSGLTLRDGAISVGKADTDVARFSNNSITSDVIDKNGLLFLPAAGNRGGASISSVGSEGCYWSSTAYSSTSARLVYFYGAYFYSQNSSYRYNGVAVRLAREN